MTTTDLVPQEQNFGKRPNMFLRLLAECGDVRKAATSVGYKDAAAFYALRRRNAAFKAAWQDAENQFADILEAEARRRAVQGVKKDVYYKGEICGEEVVYSDGLMAKLLEGAKPDRYKPKSDGASTNINVKVGVAVLPAQAANLADWERESIELHRGDRHAIEGECEEVKQPEPEPRRLPEANSQTMVVKV